VSETVYEGMFLLSSQKLHSNWDRAAEIVHSILDRFGCEIVLSRPWEERRLAYPIKKQRRGMYYLVYFKAPPEAISKIEHECNINDAILRQLILKLHPKLVEGIMAQAQAYIGGDEYRFEGVEEAESEEEAAEVAEEETPEGETVEEEA